MTDQLPTTKKISCAVVGLKQGLETVHVLLNHPAFDLKVVCDPDREPYRWITGAMSLEKSEQEYVTFPHIKLLLEHLTKAPNIARLEDSADYAEVLKRKDIEAVFLFVPDALHEEFTLAALRAGKYVMCTKPMAMSIESAQTIAREAKRFPHHYMLGFQFSYSPFAQKVLEQIKGGSLGNIRQISFHYHRGQFRPINRKKAISRGPIVQETCHWFDLLYLFSGKSKFTKVAGFGGIDLFQSSQDVEDNGVLIVEYENHIRSAVLFTYFRPCKHPEFLTINGDRGQLRGSFDRLVIENDAGEQVITVGSNRKLPGLFHDGYYEMHDEFAAMVRENREPYSGWETGLENVILSDAAQKALDRGGIVRRGEQ